MTVNQLQILVLPYRIKEENFYYLVSHTCRLLSSPDETPPNPLIILKSFIISAAVPKHNNLSKLYIKHDTDSIILSSRNIFSEGHTIY